MQCNSYSKGFGHFDTFSLVDCQVQAQDEAQAQVQRNHGVAPVSVSQVSTLKASDAYHHEESLSPNHNTEEERIMAILERIQVLKPEYKQRYFIYEYRKSQMITH